MMNPFSWLQMTNMISYQGLVRTFPNKAHKLNFDAMMSAVRHMNEQIRWHSLGCGPMQRKLRKSPR
ncbi:hypothetical protein ACK3Y5_20870, partial [Aeromonas caviae]